MAQIVLVVNMDKIDVLRRIAETGKADLIGADMVPPEKARPIIEVFDQLGEKRQRRFLAYSVGFMFHLSRKILNR